MIAIAGLSTLGRPFCEVGFRCELICALLGVTPETSLTPALLAQLLTSSQGQFKNVVDTTRFRIFFNQATNRA